MVCSRAGAYSPCCPSNLKQMTMFQVTMNCNFALGKFGYCPHSNLHQDLPVRGKSTPQRREYHRNRQNRNKQRVFLAYGGAQCQCCGENNLECLSIDHIAGNGAQHRRELEKDVNLYRWLIRNNFPSGF